MYPTPRQKKILYETIETCRRVYNDALLDRRENWEKVKHQEKEVRQTISYVDQVKGIIDKRKTNWWLQRVEAQVLNDVLNRVRKAYEKFISSLINNVPHGLPNLKKKGDYKSFTYPSMKKGRFGKVSNNKVFLSRRIGEVKIRYHRELPDNCKVKTLTVVKKLNEWYLIYKVELLKPDERSDLKICVGLDFGLTSLVTLSNGQHISNPAFIIQAYHKLKKTITRYQRKEKDLKNRRKATLEFLKVKQKVQHQRDDYRHKVTRAIINACDVVFYEGLHFFNLGKNTHMNIHISDAGWGTIARMLEYKARLEGKMVFSVPPQNSSQLCSFCDTKIPKTVEVKIHKCYVCGLEMDRDENASRTILKRGLVLYGHLLTSPEELRGRACLSSLTRDAMIQEVRHHGE